MPQSGARISRSGPTCSKARRTRSLMVSTDSTSSVDPDRDALAQHHVVAEDRASVDDDSRVVLDPESASDSRFAGQLDSGGDLHQKVGEPVERLERSAQEPRRE